MHIHVHVDYVSPPISCWSICERAPAAELHLGQCKSWTLDWTVDCNMAVYNRWTGLLEWTGRMERPSSGNVSQALTGNVFMGMHTRAVVIFCHSHQQWTYRLRGIPLCTEYTCNYSRLSGTLTFGLPTGNFRLPPSWLSASMLLVHVCTYICTYMYMYM